MKIIMSIILICIISYVFAQDIIEYTDPGSDTSMCVWTSPYSDHSEFDLRPLQAKPGNEYHTADQLFTYYMNFCGNSYLCGHQNVMIGQVLGQQCIPIAKWTRPEWDLIDHNRPELGPQMTFHTGDAGGCPAPRTATVQFHCQKNADPAGVITVHEDPKIKCNYVYVVPTVYGCPEHVLATSTGTLVLIFGILLTVIYFSVGCFLNSRKSQTSCGTIENFPHLEFWKTLPGLVKDGNSYFFSSIFSIFKRKDTGYGSKPNSQDYPGI